MTADKVLMCGNEADAEAAIVAGVDAYFGYPITPQNELTAYMALHMPQRGRIFVQKRTTTKDLYPGYFDVAAGGVLTEGETYDESAAREAHEELGLIAVPLEPHFDFYHEDDTNRCWGRVYSCVHDGPFQLQAEEIESGWFASLAEVRSGAIAPITPDTLLALERPPTEGNVDRAGADPPPAFGRLVGVPVCYFRLL